MENNKPINLCVVHYNTPQFMSALLESIKKFVPNFHLYIFENSDKFPFTVDNENVTVIDNTKGQIINFNEWLKLYPNHKESFGKINAWGSAKHCYTIQKCMDIINEPFILMDSDILLKQDITPLFDENFIYVGTITLQGNKFSYRISPNLCFINVKMCNEKKVNFFDDGYILGLRNLKKNPDADKYDTGASFMMECEPYPHKIIKINDFIVHYGSGSYSYIYNDKPSPEQWLEANKQYYM